MGERTAMTSRGVLFSLDFKARLFSVPKTVSYFLQRPPVVLHAFRPHPMLRFDKCLHLNCPVRALRIYLQRTVAFRSTDRLLVDNRTVSMGLALSSQQLSGCQVEGITEAYISSGKPYPELRAHTTRGTATSIAVITRVDWKVIHLAVMWQGNLQNLSTPFLFPGSMQGGEHWHIFNT